MQCLVAYWPWIYNLTNCYVFVFICGGHSIHNIVLPAVTCVSWCAVKYCIAPESNLPDGYFHLCRAQIEALDCSGVTDVIQNCPWNLTNSWHIEGQEVKNNPYSTTQSNILISLDHPFFYFDDRWTSKQVSAKMLKNIFHVVAILKSFGATASVVNPSNRAAGSGARQQFKAEYLMGVQAVAVSLTGLIHWDWGK